MKYITIRQYRKPVQLKFEDVLFGKADIEKWSGESDRTGTITRCVNEIPPEYKDKIDVDRLITWLQRFYEKNKSLFKEDMSSLYRHYKIPKKTGGWRPIDEPCPELQKALGDLADFFKEDCGMLYHTAAFAYIDNRSTVDAVRKHVAFKSNWFLKTDISGFFPHTTLDFAFRMLSMVYPLSEVVEIPAGREALKRALSLGFLNNGLPQGTKLSPIATNLMMIPIDHYLFGEFAKRAMVYTRYADDMHISAKENFPYKKAVGLIEESFRRFNAPFKIKDEKTHYGSVCGKNWLLGLMANQNYEITVGWRNKKYFKAALCNFILDTKNNIPWDLDEVRHLQGLLSYYRMIEKDYFNKLIVTANRKWNVNVDDLFKSYLNVA